MTAESLAAVPLRFRFLRDAKQTGRLHNSPFLLFDYEKPIDFARMFDGMDPTPIDGDSDGGGVHVKGMYMRPVKRPGGGFRLNFGGKNIFGNTPMENTLFTTYTEIDAKARNEKLMTRLRQMPIHASMDFRTVLSRRENNEIIGLFGLQAALVAGSISIMGGRPALDLYSAMGPGEGVVGQYLAQRPGQARLLGALTFAPGMILAADLGAQVPRSLWTLANAAPKGSDIKDLLEPVLGLLESWTGELNVVATGIAPPALHGDKIGDVFERFGKSLEGTILFGVEADSSAEIVKSLEGFLSSEAAKNSEFAFETLEDGGKKSFRSGGKAARSTGVKHLALGAGEKLVVISIANSLETCLQRRDGALAKRGTVPLPTKFGLIQGPVKLWVQNDTLRYVPLWYRMMRGMLAGSSVKHRAEWIQAKLEKELLSENLAVSLSWARKYGVMLRVLF